MSWIFLPGPSRRLGPVLKCRRFLSFFQRYIVRDISLTRYFRSLAHWNLIRHFEKHEAWRTVKSFLFPNLYDAFLIWFIEVKFWIFLMRMEFFCMQMIVMISYNCQELNPFLMFIIMTKSKRRDCFLYNCLFPRGITHGRPHLSHL